MPPRLTRVDRQKLRWKPRPVDRTLLDQIQHYLVPIIERRLTRPPNVASITSDVAERAVLRSHAADLIGIVFEVIARRLRDGDADFLHHPAATKQLVRAVRAQQGGLVRWLPMLDRLKSTLIHIAVAICVGYLRAQFPVLNPVTVAIAARVIERVLERRSGSIV